MLTRHDTTSDVLAQLGALGVRPSGVSDDSRQVVPGDLFLAYPGDLADGRHYIAEAIVNGAAAVLWESAAAGSAAFAWRDEWKIANLPVSGLRQLCGPLAHVVCGRPSERLSLVAVTGTNGKTTVARMLAHIHKMSGATVGLCTTDGVYIDGERTVVGDMTGPMAAQMVLRDPSVDLAVLETARGGLLRAGMGYRSCNVGAVLNVSPDHLGLGGIDTLDQLAEVKRIVVEVARDCAVLNADDERCLRMADYTEATRIGYVTTNPRHDLVRKHIRAGGLAIVLEEGINGDMITIYDRGTHVPLLWTHLIPATLEGKAMHNVNNAMFAALMTYAMGVKVENIRHGLRTFDTTYFQAPGRLNVYDELPFKVILDYGHNPAAVRAMAALVRRLDVLSLIHI